MREMEAGDPVLCFFTAFFALIICKFQNISVDKVIRNRCCGDSQDGEFQKIFGN